MYKLYLQYIFNVWQNLELYECYNIFLRVQFIINPFKTEYYCSGERCVANGPLVFLHDYLSQLCLFFHAQIFYYTGEKQWEILPCTKHHTWEMWP